MILVAIAVVIGILSAFVMGYWAGKGGSGGGGWDVPDFVPPSWSDHAPAREGP
jgi:hypothetical protein